ncbi:MAG TPA: phage baseplate assembly protein V [Longimicrobium sp.]|nr:phage baseplate assembly protein V [Longimicrobium sp.]
MKQGPFWGKYRGTVTDAQDPKREGRVKARVPDVYGDEESGWATACMPVGGSQTGLFGVPKVGAGVWIEFEHGDPQHPVWTGCYRGSMAELPGDMLATVAPEKNLMLITQGGHKLLLDDTPGMGGITLETSGGQKITLKSTGVEITDGMGAKITLGPDGISIDNGKQAKVELRLIKTTINGGALEVS